MNTLEWMRQQAASPRWDHLDRRRFCEAVVAMEFLAAVADSGLAPPGVDPVEAKIVPRYREGYRQVLQAALDLASVCDRAQFRPSDHEVVKHALTTLNRHLAAIVSPAPAGGAGANHPHVAERGWAGAGDTSLEVENGGGR